MAMQISAIAEMGRCTLTTASAAPASATPTTSTSAASASAVGWTRARGSFRRGGRAAWRLERCAVVARRWGRCWHRLLLRHKCIEACRAAHTAAAQGRLHVGAARILELRKLNGKQRVLRHSVHTCDASHCMAVIAPLVERAGWWLPDRLRAPLLVPVLSLGRCMAATEGSGAQAGSCSLAVADREAAAGRAAVRDLLVARAVSGGSDGAWRQ
jgi:hypothetical protein